MTVLYSITNSLEFQGGSVTLANGDTFPFSSDHPRYDAIVAALLSEADEKTIFSMVSPFEAIFLNFTQITDRVSRKGMKLFFDGDVLNNTIASAIISSMDEEGYKNGQVWRSYVAFLERLMTNPSEDSRQHLYHYVEAHGLTITRDGMLVLYKGVVDNAGIEGVEEGVYHSNHAGPGIVARPDGQTTHYERAQLPNAVGYVVSIPRAQVDTNRGAHCSVGLHAGTYEYARSFAPVLLTVLVDPRDVVSVPDDVNNAKVRVCRYTVLEVNAGVEYKNGIMDDSVDDEDDDVELSDEEIYAQNKTHEFMDILPELVLNHENLRRYRNKRVTSKARPYFDAAMTELDYEY